MSFYRVITRKQPVLTATAVLFLLTALAFPASAQLRLELTVEDVVVQSSQAGVEIPVYLSNCCDTITGFQIWLQLNRPDFTEFTLELVTEGTLIEGWGYNAGSLAGQNWDLLITTSCYGEGCSVPPYDLAILPQESDIPLLKILTNVYELPDTMIERTADVLLQHDMLDHFGFADYHGNSVGIITEEISDTNYYVCNQWSGDLCVDSSRVTKYDAWEFFHVSTVLHASLDTSAVKIYDGTLSLGPLFKCGDINCTSVMDISDLTYFVDYMFGGGPAPRYWQAADCDADGQITISDITCIVCYLFQSCPPPLCLPE
jgi:hypothetical protein